MCRTMERIPFSYVVTTGDNFYSPDGTATKKSFNEPAACLLSRKVTFKATWGNHDVAGKSTGEVLGAKRRYVWTEEGVAFFMLDSNRASDPDQRDWLEEQLRAHDEGVKIAVFHHPPYTVGEEHDPNDDVQRNWVPLFEEYGVDLVLTGHNHLYEHLRVDSIDYVVSGGGGQDLYNCGKKKSWSLECVEKHHFLLVRVMAEQIDVRAISASGDEIDRFKVPLRERVGG
jgi:tartrate-resistant acid phosphatase type 5